MRILLIISLLFCFAAAKDDFFEPGTTIGGYGELHYNNKIIDDADPTTKLDFHRWILFINHNFTSEWSMKSELEIEHNMIDGNGDYDGEVELEQAYINYHNADGNWGYGAGVVLISAGIINETHEPPTFLSVERPSYNSKIIPTTWFGNGAHVYGTFGDFNAKFVLHEDMKGDDIVNGTGLRSGRAKGYKSTANSWTMNFSGNYTGIDGLTLGGSMTMNDSPRSDYIEDVLGNGTEGFEDTNENLLLDDDELDYTIDDITYSDRSIAWNLMEGHATYNINNIVLVAEFGMISYNPSDGWSDATEDYGDGNGNGEFEEGEETGTWTKGSEEYGNSMGYYMQAGYDVSSLINWEDCKLVPWLGIGMYNLDDTDDTGSVNTTQFGVTWWPTDKVSWKFDYTVDTKDAIETNTLSLGVGYMF